GQPSAGIGDVMASLGVSVGYEDLGKNLSGDRGGNRTRLHPESRSYRSCALCSRSWYSRHSCGPSMRLWAALSGNSVLAGKRRCEPAGDSRSVRLQPARQSLSCLSQVWWGIRQLHSAAGVWPPCLVNGTHAVQPASEVSICLKVL